VKILIGAAVILGGYFVLLKMKGNAVSAAASTCGNNVNCPALTAAQAKWAWVPDPPPFI
jgi:hypothetical protein